MRNIAIVGSKSLEGYETIYELIVGLIQQEINANGSLVLLNGGEEGVDTMAGEVALALGLDYEIVPLSECSFSCDPVKKFCFKHSYEPRSHEIAERSDMIYRIFDEGCGTSTCEVTARFGDEYGKQVRRIPIDVLAMAR
jgi:hypothetical protein